MEVDGYQLLLHPMFMDMEMICELCVATASTPQSKRYLRTRLIAHTQAGLRGCSSMNSLIKAAILDVGNLCSFWNAGRAL